MFNPVAGFELSPQDQGADDVDSDANDMGMTILYDLSGGGEDLTIDAGYYEFASLGDLVWLDANGDGLNNNGEEGVESVVVALYTDPDMDGQPNDFVAETETDLNGFYEFTQLVPGKYVVEFTAPTDREFTISNTGGFDTDDTDINDDSDVDPTTGLSHTIMLISGENDPKIDAGIYELLSLGNFVWDDINNDGIFDDATETAIPNVVLALWMDMNNDGFPDMDLGRSAITDGNGQYLFDNLVPGDYIVQVVPANFTNGVLADYTTSSGNDPAPDPDNNVNFDDNGYDPGLEIGIISLPITLASNDEPVDDEDADNSSNLTVDFGFFDDATIGNYVFEDNNANGLQGDPAVEPGINDVVVNLYTADGTFVATTTTRENPDNAAEQGYYLFDRLVPGDYYVEIETPTGYILTDPNVGGNDAIDSDIADENGPNTTQTVTLGAGEENLTLDAGIYLEAQLGDFVWLDGDGPTDNIQDANEPGINGVTVNLYSSSDPMNPIATQVTRPGPNGNDGYYLFTGLRADTYIVEFERPEALNFVAANDPDGDDNTDSDVADEITGRTLAFPVLPGDFLDDVDAGLSAAVLPVEFVDFDGEYIAERKLSALYWVTGSEINSNYFEVERSYEGAMFETIGKVDAAGNSLTESNYTFDDEDVKKSGNYYYRLRQVDFDGSFEYSRTIVLNVNRASTGTSRIYPNPAIGHFNIEVDMPEGANMTAFIIDATGKVIRENIITETLAPGVSEIRVPIDNLMPGTYMVRLDINGNVSNHKLLVLNR